MQSERLSYRPIAPADIDAFHRLVQDEHVRRYLLDGEVMPREWTEARIRDNQELFDRRGVGLWLAYVQATGELVGFCGFMELPSAHGQPELVYAMFERFSGKGYGTEMARASIAAARAKQRDTPILASVDEVNAASLRLLEKLGFKKTSTRQGTFGNMFLLELDGADP